MFNAEEKKKKECSQTLLLMENSEIRGSARQKPTSTVSVITGLGAIRLKVLNLLRA